ncbi:hypothetical protein A2U01_0087430, partial [Trifolium medium]|nr:hypothetical protein [Trifolium medium]
VEENYSGWDEKPS